MSVRLPDTSQHTVIFGRTGTGKTQFGAWLLSTYIQAYPRFPWVIFDTKGEKFLQAIAKLPNVKTIRVGERINPNGITYLRPLPHEMKSDAMEAFLWTLHARQNVGIFFDEGLMLDKYSNALLALYTQGRSLHIPIITLSQIPKHLMLVTFSEASFFAVFMLNDEKDRKRVEDFMPPLRKMPPDGRPIVVYPGERLPEHHSLWYDVGANSVVEFSPVPSRAEIMAGFEATMRPVKRVI